MTSEMTRSLSAGDPDLITKVSDLADAGERFEIVVKAGAGRRRAITRALGAMKTGAWIGPIDIFRSSTILACVGAVVYKNYDWEAEDTRDAVVVSFFSRSPTKV